jgi:hypothetical protein
VTCRVVGDVAKEDDMSMYSESFGRCKGLGCTCVSVLLALL